jgi:hypothetical protein
VTAPPGDKQSSRATRTEIPSAGDLDRPTPHADQRDAAGTGSVCISYGSMLTTIEDCKSISRNRCRWAGVASFRTYTSTVRAS